MRILRREAVIKLSNFQQWRTTFISALTKPALCCLSFRLTPSPLFISRLILSPAFPLQFSSPSLQNPKEQSTLH